MLRVRYLRNKYQKRTLRVLYNQTHAYPFAGFLAPGFRNTDGSLHMPLAADGNVWLPNRSADASTYKSGLLPGTVMILTGTPGTGATGLANGSQFSVAVGNTTERPFGLLANFVGGDLDELGDENEIGVWRGPDSVVEVLQPAFNPTGITSSALATAANAGAPAAVYAGTDGRLTTASPGGGATVVGRLLDANFVGAAPNRIVVELAI